MIHLLIDCHALGYRAHYAMGQLSKGDEPTGVAFGFLSELLLLAEQSRTNRFIFCWDGTGSRRRTLFPDYKKARRIKTPEEWKEIETIHLQFNALRDEILPRMGFENNLREVGYEADDLIARTIASNPKRLFLIVSGDNDLYQLLRFPNCRGQRVLHGRNTVLHSADILARHGVPARDWATLKAICGCDGDGVPGIKGIGWKTAAKFLNGELNQKSKAWQAISNNAELLRRNYQLVALPLPGLPKIDLQEDRLDVDEVFQIFDDLGFNSFLKTDNRNRWERFIHGEWK